MGYAVFHRDVTGTPQVEDVASLEAAVATVERLRNEDAASDVRVFREVPLEVRTYYKVVVAEDVAAEPVAVATAPAGAVAETAPIAPVVEPVDAPEDVVVPVPPAPVASASPVDALPGAFPLAGPSAVPAVEVHDHDLDATAENGRRHSLFGRGG